MPLETLRTLSRPWRAALRTAWLGLQRRLLGVPAVGRVDLGDLGRTAPLCADYGFSRGTPVDRVYIERFLERHAAGIRGVALEVGSDGYCRRFGGGRVTAQEVVDVDPRNARATLLADLADAPQLGSARFDSMVITQTLQLVPDAQAALATLSRALRPGGTLLLTTCGVSATAGDPARWCWSFTERSLRLMLERAFPGAAIEVEARGNVLTAVAFLEGLAAADLAPDAFATDDPAYPVVVLARVVKPATGG